MATLLADFIRFESDIQIAKRVNVASLALFAYDFVLTLPDEIEYIWSTGWSMLSVLCATARISIATCLALAASLYLLEDVSLSTCRGIYISTLITSWLGALPVGFMLCLRTYALYVGSTRMKIFFIILFGIWVSGTTVLSLIGVIQSNYVPLPFKGLTCVYTLRPAPDYVSASLYGGAAVYEVFLSVLSAYGVVRQAVPTGTQLTAKMLRHGVALSAMISVVSALNFFFILFLPAAHAPLKVMLGNILVTTSVIVMCRILVDLKKYSARKGKFGNGTRFGSSSRKESIRTESAIIKDRRSVLLVQ